MSRLVMYLIDCSWITNTSTDENSHSMDEGGPAVKLCRY